MKLITEAWDNILEDDKTLDSSKYNSVLGSENKGLKYTKYGLHGIDAGVTAAMGVADDDPVVVGLSAARALTFGLLAKLSYDMREEKHKIMLKKVAEKFPTAESMLKFLNSKGLNANGLTPDMDAMSYGLWLKKNILKQGKFWRIFGQFLFGSGIFGIPYNYISKENKKRSTAEKIVQDQLS